MSDFPTHWDLRPLEEVMDAIIDYRGKTPKKTDTGVPLITAKIVKNGRIETPAEFIAEDAYDDWMVRGLPEVGDVVVTTEAPLGEVAQLVNSNVALAQRIVTLRGKKDVLGNDFLLFLMQSKYVQEQLEARASGSTVRGIKQSELRKVTLAVPPVDEQIKISKHLKAIDNKIELNRQINLTLEQIAQAIFKSWFVDFEPVKAKIQAKQNGQDPERAAMRAISGKTDEELDALNEDQRQQLSTTAALFPDELEESELGEIPKEWSAGKLGDLYSAKGGYAYKSKDFISEGNPVVKIKNITGSGTVDLIDVQYIDDETALKSSRFALSDGDLIMAMTGATVGKTGFIVVNNNTTPYLNQRVAKLESNFKDNEPSWFVFCLFKLHSKFEELVGNASGSAQPNISSAGIESTSIVVAPHKIVSLFNKSADSLFKIWIVNNKENSSLANIRDALLPKLLSGEMELT